MFEKYDHSGEGTYQQVVSVSIGVIEDNPSRSIGAAGITTIRIVQGEVRGLTTGNWSEELGRVFLQLSV